MSKKTNWDPPEVISRDAALQLHREVIALPTRSIKIREDIFRLRELELDWDIGAVIYEPQDESFIPRGPDGRKIGIFLLHGGVSDFKSVEHIAQLLTEKFGVKVVSLTFPGRFFFNDPSRDWPGDVENADGSARTPLWTKETRIAPDQYTVVNDQSKR